ncbi:MAG TPA: ribosomal-protein-alanine N-acetyltransferase [Nitrospirae bacterium]|nr:ribosomal-protein-alanine N-acetyltransferase [Nitrospirota bacterium]HDK82273.1 ribosomal-protein-alanine N-acetyltransferase [Nitrospirota bacterium]HDO25453.1 ribosomal-protein-alanine N-acetyltransferase [Nitrospirota bacterium]
MEVITFRRASPDDLREIYSIEKLCFTTPWSINSFSYELVNKDSILKVAVFKNNIIGYVCIRIILDVTHVLNLAVSHEFRRMGIGSELLRYALHELEVLRPDIDVITLEVRTSNKEAVKLYEKFGFKHRGRRTDYYLKPPEDAVIMALDIKKNVVKTS